jgi:hypothetical protein
MPGHQQTTASRSVGVRAFHERRLGTVAVYRIDAAHASPSLVTNAALTKYSQ